MEQFLYPVITAFLAALITCFFATRKSLAAEKAVEQSAPENTTKYYCELLHQIAVQITVATDIIKKMKIEHKELIMKNNQLVDELQKFKQLNRKQ